MGTMTLEHANCDFPTYVPLLSIIRTVTLQHTYHYSQTDEPFLSNIRIESLLSNIRTELSLCNIRIESLLTNIRTVALRLSRPCCMVVYSGTMEVMHNSLCGWHWIISWSCPSSFLFLSFPLLSLPLLVRPLLSSLLLSSTLLPSFLLFSPLFSSLFLFSLLSSPLLPFWPLLPPFPVLPLISCLSCHPCLSGLFYARTIERPRFSLRTL
jgi:hypothetical protein